MISDMIQSSTTKPKAIKIYFTILPPIFLIIILVCMVMSMTNESSLKQPTACDEGKSVIQRVSVNF